MSYLYLIELYVNGGSDIKFAWVRAKDRKQAREFVTRYIPGFHDIITVDVNLEPHQLLLSGDHVYGINLTIPDIACDHNPLWNLHLAFDADLD